MSEGAAPVPVSHPVLRHISCLRCGPLYDWSWADGDSPRVAELNGLFKTLHHGRWWTGHILRLREEQT